MKDNLITKALEIHSDLDEGEIVEVEIVAKAIFDLVERLEAANKIVDESGLYINHWSNCEIESGGYCDCGLKGLRETIKEYKESCGE